MRRLVSLPLGALAASLALPAAAQDFALPFIARDAAGIIERQTECPAAPEPMLSLDLASKYGEDGPERDDVDEKAEAAFDAAMTPLRDYSSLVVRYANRFTDKGRRGDADCALALLAAWARADALARPRSHTAVFKLATTLSGLGMAYLQVKAAATEEDRAAIEAWFARQARRIRTHFDALATPRAKVNNHRAWAGLAVAVSGLVAQDKPLLDWGLTSYEAAACHAEASGMLPTEIVRGKKARDYHLFALAPLTMLAEIGEANGWNSASICEGALGRIMAFSLAAIDDPTAIEEMAEHPQAPFPKGDAVPPANRLAFLEPALRRWPGAFPIEARARALRPLKAIDLGGDMTLLFGSP
jgi:poly(beta-D-mannuronate) lyase